MASTKNKKECAAHGCHRTTDKKYCPLHTALDKPRKRSGSDPRPYMTKEWKAVRAVILQRDPVCRCCNSAPSRTADHIIPWKEYAGSFFDMNNLQGLCLPCHSAKTFSGR